MPGASATVQVRGVTTMSDSSPLILVDGMTVSYTHLDVYKRQSLKRTLKSLKTVM